MTIPIDNIDSKEDKEIEDLFELETINNELILKKFENKTFDKKKEHGDSGHIGKEIFANTILKNYQSDSINFEQFKPLLDLIDRLSIDYTEFQSK